MKFSCDKAVLSAAVSNVSRAGTTRTALQALEGIMIRAEGDTLTLTGYDLELGITTVIPAAVSEEGSIILGARLFGEMIRKLEGGEVFVASYDKLLTEIRGGGAEFTILGMDAADYPELPGLGDVSWAKYVSALTDIGYSGYTCIEVEDRAFEGSRERILDSLRLSKRYLEQYVI